MSDRVQIKVEPFEVPDAIALSDEFQSGRSDKALELIREVVGRMIKRADELNLEANAAEQEPPFIVSHDYIEAEIWENVLLLGGVRRAGYLLGRSEGQKDAELDSVTWLPNRNAWDRALGDEIDKRSGESDRRKDKHELFVVFIDLNDFKAINEEHGHMGGDEALFNAAAIIVENVREDDLVARLGGDEFAVMLKVPKSDTVDEDIERKRLAIKEALDTEFTTASGDTISHSASVGVARLEIGDGIKQLMGRANDEMFIDKRTYRETA